MRCVGAIPAQRFCFSPGDAGALPPPRCGENEEKGKCLLRMKVPKSELAILEILWSAGVPLTRCEIRERLEEPTKDAVVSIRLNNLRDKKLIRGAGYVRSAGDWCRRYKPRVTREEIEG